MNSHILKNAAAACALALSAWGAQAAPAADLHLDGHIAYNTDVVRIDFDLATAGAVSLWTDSWQAGLNFDPTVSLFDSTGLLIATGDDTADPAALHTGQGGYDSSLDASLTAGHYILTLSASGNDPVGATLTDGFSLAGTTPVLLSDWNQPSYDINKNDQKLGLWSLWLSGADSAAVVPEPGSLAMILGGIAMFMGRRRLLTPGR